MGHGDDSRQNLTQCTVLPSAILRRLATYSLQLQEPALFAFRELGRVVRTDFLLHYLGSADLRRTIGAATNKSELQPLGSYELDLTKPPAPLSFELPPQRQPSRQRAAVLV